MSDRAVRVIVSGRVQGVGFRYFVEREAIRLGIFGWVRNRRDGTVEAVFLGTAAQVEAMLKATKKGPPPSKVDEMKVADASADDLELVLKGERFSTLATA
jgi:acylphosphatase